MPSLLVEMGVLLKFCLDWLELVLTFMAMLSTSFDFLSIKNKLDNLKKKLTPVKKKSNNIALYEVKRKSHPSHAISISILFPGNNFG
jgi:hypothetical protein